MSLLCSWNQTLVLPLESINNIQGLCAHSRYGVLAAGFWTHAGLRPIQVLFEPAMACNAMLQTYTANRHMIWDSAALHTIAL